MLNSKVVIMKKFLLVIILFSVQYNFAVDFMHDIGLGFWSKLRNTKTAEPTSYGPNIQYMPRVNFSIKDNMSISIASPIGLGARFHPYQGNYFQMQLPVTTIFNIGHASFKKEKHLSNIGGFFGTGFNYILSASETLRESDYGLIALTGMRFYTHHHSIGVNFHFTHDFKFKNNFVGAGLFYTFGYFE